MIYLSVYRLRDDIELPTYGTTLANCSTIRKGDRIAQGEIACNEPFHIAVCNTRPEKHSERAGGFGSTGVSSETPPMEDWKVDGPTNFG